MSESRYVLVIESVTFMVGYVTPFIVGWGQADCTVFDLCGLAFVVHELFDFLFIISIFEFSRFFSHVEELFFVAAWMNACLAMGKCLVIESIACVSSTFDEFKSVQRWKCSWKFLSTGFFPASVHSINVPQCLASQEELL